MEITPILALTAHRKFLIKNLKTNKRKYKNPVIISVDAEKAAGKVQHPFTIKTFYKVGVDGT